MVRQRGITAETVCGAEVSQVRLRRPLDGFAFFTEIDGIMTGPISPSFHLRAPPA